MKNILALVLLVTCAGCSAFKINVPANELVFKSANGSLSLKHPQNTDMGDVLIRIETNGAVEAKIGTLHTVNSPEVIDKTAAGEVAKINALGEQVREAVKAGAEAMGAGAGAAVKTAK